MDLESVALEAVKVKIQEIFDKISVSTQMEGADILIRIKLSDAIANNLDLWTPENPQSTLSIFSKNKDLDSAAQAAADELLGTPQDT